MVYSTRNPCGIRQRLQGCCRLARKAQDRYTVSLISGRTRNLNGAMASVDIVEISRVASCKQWENNFAYDIAGCIGQATVHSERARAYPLTAPWQLSLGKAMSSSQSSAPFTRRRSVPCWLTMKPSRRSRPVHRSLQWAPRMGRWWWQPCESQMSYRVTLRGAHGVYNGSVAYPMTRHGFDLMVAFLFESLSFEC